jgi:threonine dehydratase
MARTGSLARISLELPDRPGALATATTLIGTLGGNILDVDHQRTFCGGLDIKHARLIMTISTEGAEHSKRVADGLVVAGFPCVLEPISSA